MTVLQDLKNLDVFIVITSFTVGVLSSPWSMPLYTYIIYLLVMEILYYIMFGTTPIQRIVIVIFSFIGWIVGKALFGWYDISNQRITDDL